MLRLHYTAQHVTPYSRNKAEVQNIQWSLGVFSLLFCIGLPSTACAKFIYEVKLSAAYGYSVC